MTMRKTMSHVLSAALLLTLATTARANPEGAADNFRTSYQLEAKGDYAGALARMNALRSAGDTSYFVLLRTAWLRYLAGDLPGATSGYRAAIAAKPKAVEPKVGLTLVLFAARDWKALDVACRDALSSAPGDPTLRARQAAAHYNLGRYPDAASLYRKLIDEYPAVLDYQTGYAWALHRMGKRKEAKAAFHAVLAVSPDNANAQQGLQER
jgi:tetratricopeptide (TPR) repeat protein